MNLGKIITEAPLMFKDNIEASCLFAKVFEYMHWVWAKGSFGYYIPKDKDINIRLTNLEKSVLKSFQQDRVRVTESGRLRVSLVGNYSVTAIYTLDPQYEVELLDKLMDDDSIVLSKKKEIWLRRGFIC